MEWKYSDGRIYSVDESENVIAEATYEMLANGVMNVDHVYVNPEYRGQGIAEKVMLTIVGYLREHKLKATATCSYASAWFNKHEKECEDILSHEFAEQVIACRIDGRH